MKKRNRKKLSSKETGTGVSPSMPSYPFPESVVMNILSRLPVKSLMQLKCISKAWCTLIEKSAFISEHLKQNTSIKKNGAILVKCRNGMKGSDSFFLHSDETYEMPVTYFSDDWMVEIEMIASCNGIICLSDKRYENLALWNPATRELKALPKSIIHGPPGLRFSNTRAGFGFDVSTNDYKVVRNICQTNDDGQLQTYQIEIYKLSTDSWYVIGDAIPVSYIRTDPCPKTYINGVYYWLAKDNLLEDTILSFNFIDEVFQTTSLPIICAASSYANYEKHFSLLRESFSLILFPRLKERWFEIWILKEHDFKEWTKLYTTGLIIGCPWPLGFSKDGELFLETQNEVVLWKNGNLCLESPNELVLCNPTTHVIKNLQVEGEPRSFEVLPYAESLVFLKGANELAEMEIS